MKQEIKYYKLAALPAIPEKGAIYFIPNGIGSDVDQYIVDKDGTAFIFVGRTNANALTVSAGVLSGTAGQLNFGNANGVTFGYNPFLSQITASVNPAPNGMTAGMSNLGNTSGNTGTVTNRLIFAGGNNITLSQQTGVAGNTIYISANSVGAGVSIQGSTGNISFANSNGITFGGNNSTLTASYTVPTDYISTQLSTLFQQTSLMSNYLGTSYTTHTHSQYLGTNYTSHTHSEYQASSLMTDYLQTNYTSHTHTQSGQAFSAGLGSSTFETLSFQDSNGVSFSNNAGAIRLVHDLQFTSNTSAITSNALNTSQSSLFQQTSQMTDYLGTAYTTHTHTQLGQAFSAQGGSSTFQTLQFVNGNGFTFTNVAGSVRGSYHRVTYDGDAGTIVPTYVNFNSDGTTVNDNAIGFYMSLDGVSATIYGTHNGLITQSAQVVSVSNSSIQAETVSFGNSNSISFYATNGSVVASYNNPALAGTGFTSAGTNISFSGTLNTNGLSLQASVAAQTNQSLGLYASSNTTLTSSGTVDARSLSFRGIGIVTVGVSASEVLISATQSVDTGKAGTGFTSAGNNIGLSGTLNTNGLSLSATVAAQTVQTQNLHNVTLSGNTSGVMAQVSSGTLTLAGGNNITLSQNGNAITISGANVGGAQTAISGIVASDATYTSGTVTFRDGNGITWASTTGQQISITHALQYTSATSAITASAVNTSVTSNFAGTGVTTAGGAGLSATLGTNGLSVSIPSWLTTAALSSQTLAFTLSGNSATTNSSQILNGGYALAGGNGVTLAQSNNTVSISVATNYQSQGAYLTTAAQSTQTFLASLGGNSGTTNSSRIGNGGFVFAGGNGVTINQSNNSVSWSVATAYQSQGAYLTTAAQSTQTVAISLGGNVATTNSSVVSAGGYVLAGGNGVTIQQSNATLSLSVATNYQSQGAYLTTAAQSTQTNVFSISGNVGTTNSSVLSAGGYVIAGGSNITLSQSNNSLSIHAQSQSTVPQNASLFALGNTTQNSSTQLSVNALSLNAIGSLTIGYSNGSIQFSAPNALTTQSVQTQSRFNLTLSGNSTSGGAGYIQISSGVMTLAGGNNVTLSQDGNAVTISAAAGGAATAISGIIGSNTTYTSGSVSLRDLNGITWQSTTGQAFQITHDLQYTSATSAITSNALNTSASRVINIVAATNSTGGGTASLSSNVSFSNTHNFTFFTSAGGAIVASFNNTALAGSGVTTAGNNIGLSGTLNSAGLSLSATVAAQTNQTIGGYFLGNTTGQSSSSTWDARTVSFEGAGIVSVGASAGSIRISATQSNQALSGSNGSFTFQTATFGSSNGMHFYTTNGSLVGSYTVPTVTNSSFSVQDSATTLNPVARIAFSTGNNITLTLSTGASSATVGISHNLAGISTGFGGNLISASMTHNSSGLNLSLNHPAWLTTAAQSTQTFLASLSGNTATTNSSQIGNGAFAFAGGNGVTLQQSNNTVSWSVATSYRASNDAIGLNTANTNVTWTVNSSGLSINAAGYAGTGSTFNGANISGSMTHNSVGLQLSLSVAAPGAAAENNWHHLLGANTAGNTTASGSTIGLSGINLTLSGTNGSIVNISAPATSSLSATGLVSISTNGSTISIGVPSLYTFSGYDPYEDLPFAFTTNQASLLIDAIDLPNIQFDRLMIPINNTNSSNSSGSHTLSFWVGIYTQNVSTLSLLTSVSRSIALTHSGTAGSYSLYSGMRLVSIPVTSTLTQGRYWLGFVSRTTSGGANGSYSVAAISQLASNFLGHFGSSHNTTYQYALGQGIYNTTTSGIPNSIGFSQIRGSDNAVLKAAKIYFLSSTI